ncbi:hypothetical protein CJ030_MR3G019162 [Morella rubra]|uniref:Uncharacterized protein n=1 Tax=Morella rubra TaxID=262757 RepID=A0A6A1W367_9ROSI|nr:hypothetical protein CJ030_MR3G019162 [Morella rubra]
MSSSRFKRTTCQTPSFVSSRAQKRGRGNEEPADALEPSFRLGLCKNRLFKILGIGKKCSIFKFSMTEDASSFVNGKQLDLFVSSLNLWPLPLTLERSSLIHMVGWVEMTGEVREKPKDSKEYNKKTLRLMEFVQNEDGKWVKKGVVTPKKGTEEGLDFEEEDEDEEEAKTERTPKGNRTPLGEQTHISTTSL